jgi:FkbM family methyltransferase
MCVAQIKLKYPNSKVIQGVFWSEADQTLDFWIMQDRAQNSLFEPRLISENVNQVKVTTTTLDKEFSQMNLELPILLVLDVQGAELEVLRGASKLLSRVDFLICEVTKVSSKSKFAVELQDIKTCLEPFGFRKSIRRWSFSREYYDQLFVKVGFVARIKIWFFELAYLVIKLPSRTIWKP